MTPFRGGPFLSPPRVRIGGRVQDKTEVRRFALTLQEDKQKSKNLRQLRRLLKLVPADRKAVAENLLQEVVFIEEHGAIDHFKQGKQEFNRESPAVKTYNTMIQRYSLLYKQLTDMLPKPEPADKGASELLEFMKKQG